MSFRTSARWATVENDFVDAKMITSSYKLFYKKSQKKMTYFNLDEQNAYKYLTRFNKKME